MRGIAIFAMLALLPCLAWAEEQAALLKQAPGVAVVEAQCGACHSLRYVLMNAPFLDPADAKTIGDYYGG